LSVQLIVETGLGSPSRARGAGRSPDNRPTSEFLATRSPLYKTALCVVSRWHAVSGRWTVMRAPFLHIGEYLLRAREGMKIPCDLAAKLLIRTAAKRFLCHWSELSVYGWPAPWIIWEPVAIPSQRGSR
jgi:hypothetical protein